MIVADLANVTRSHGDRVIFADLSWSIDAGARIGLIGPNGIGKSTLLRAIGGLDVPDGGVVTRPRGTRVAYLAQDSAADPERTALASLLEARPDLAAIENDLAKIVDRLSDPTVTGDPGTLERVLAEQQALLDRFEHAGGPRIRDRSERLLRDLGLGPDRWDMPLVELSGGQRKLVSLATCLIGEPQLLLLDEPDNHLDLAGKRTLEGVLAAFEGAVIIVSHDRYLLDDTVDRIAELEPTTHGARLRLWEGSYSAYATQREIALRRQQQDYVAQQKDIARLEAAVKRFELWARLVVDERHIRQARNKQRQIDRMTKVERPVLERRRMTMSFHPRVRGGAIAVDLRGIGISLGGTELLRDVTATVRNGERIGLVGANGTGKTVLLQLLAGERSPDAGEVWVGPSIERGTYAQHHETLDPARTATEALRDVRPMTEGEAVSKLLRFLIPYAAAQQSVAKLSGGEKSRVQLARLMLSGANCLLLDEPTNNLDIASAEVLEDALAEFTGTVIVASHDRYFLDRVVDRIFSLDGGRLRVFDGSYTAFAEKSESPPDRTSAAAARRS